MITTRLEGKTAVSKTLQDLIASLKNRGAFFKVWAQKASLMAQQSARSHSRGGQFWPSIARLTQVTSASDSGAVVQCLHFAGYHKEHGGPIKAKNSEFLTIPLIPSAMGKRVGEWQMDNGARLFRPGPKGNKKRVLCFVKDGELTPVYALTKETKPQSPEPWWPQPEQVLDAGVMLAGEQIEREMNK
ncbi:MAG: hypothetical protein WCI01_09505 [Chlorobiaceae bacterium]